MSSDDEDMVARLLKQSILTMCKEAVHYESVLEIDGLICVSTDNNKHHIVIKIHELFHKFPRHFAESAHLDAAGKFTDVKQETKKPHGNYPFLDDKRFNSAPDRDGHMEDSESTEDEERRTAETRDIVGFQESIDKEMHTLAIYRVYKDSKNIETQRGDAPTFVRNSPGKFHDDTKNSNSIGIEVQKIKNSPNHETENFDQNIHSSAMSGKYPSLQASGLKNIHCKKCDQILENGVAYQQHNFNVHSVYTCFVCLNTFTSRNNMNRHIRIHSGTKPYSCPKCPERFTRKDDVKRHLLRHDYNKPLRCAQCCKGFTEKISVRLHMEREHGASDFHSCPLCEKCYSSMDDFQLHKKSHPELNKFSCKVCLFTGSNSLMYLKHMLMHEKDKKYSCSYCKGSQFKDPFVYTAHLKKHRSDPLVTSFNCCFCECSLPSYDQFVRHEHAHAQTRKHECKICNKVFEWPSNLREHMLVHSQEHESTPSSETSELDVTDQQDNTGSAKCDENLNEVRGSVDYWCAECNEGFASEHRLEKHILETHEVIETLSVNKEPNDSSRNANCSRVNVDDMPNDKERGFSNKFPNGETNDEENDENNEKELISLNKFADFMSHKETKNSYDNKRLICTERYAKFQTDDEEAEDLSTHPKNSGSTLSDVVQSYNRKLCNEKHERETSVEETVLDRFKPLQRNSPVSDSHGRADQSMVNKTLQRLHRRDAAVKRDVDESQEKGSLPSMSILRSNSLQNEETVDSISPKSKIPKLYNLIFGQTSVEGSKEIKTEKNNDSSDEKVKDKLIDYHSYAKMIKTEKADDEIGTLQYMSDQADIKTRNRSPSSPGPSLLDFRTSPYDVSSVLGMHTPFSSVDSAPASVKMKVRTPGFEKVVTPEILFRTKAPFTCEDCHDVFPDFRSFDQHGIIVHHSFICEYCGKIFTAKPNRERHVRYHTGEKPYKCELCDEAFFRGDDLKYHRTAKHGDIRPFVCKGCPRTFVWKKDFERHIKRYPDHR